MSGTPSTPGRRSGRRATGGRRPDVTVVLAVLLPLATVATALLVDVSPQAVEQRSPEREPLTTATVACPSAVGTSTTVGVATSEPGVTGEVSVGGATSLPVVSGRVESTDEDDAVVLAAEGEAAPGLVATRTVPGPLAAVGCGAPAADVWFTGVGAAARRASVLELVNPDAGPAVVDVDLHAARGVVDAPELRGVTVPGGGTLRLDLAERVPRRGELALHVVTTRGRVSAFVTGTYDPLGTAEPRVDWLSAQADPQARPILLGVPTGAGERTLVLANPGQDELRATVRLVTERSVFAPAGLEEVRVPAQGVARVNLAAPLADAEDVLGVQVLASAPVSATVRALTAGDLLHATPGTPLDAPTSLVLPVGEARLLLAGAESTGSVSYVARSATGKQLAADRVEVAPERGLSLELPEGTALVEVEPQGTAVVGAVRVTAGTGATVVPLTEPQRELLVPDVRPGLP